MRVTETIGPALETTKRILFRPFNIGTWLSFGVMFALQSCTDGGGVGGQFTNWPTPGGGGHGSTQSSNNAIANVLSSVLARSEAAPGLDGRVGLVVAVAAVGILIGVAFAGLLLWLGSRGQMMAIRSVATGRADIGEAWSATKAAGGRLLKFHVALAGIAVLVMIPIIGVGAALAIPVVSAHAAFDRLFLALLPIVLIALAAMIPMYMVRSLARNFVAPIMLKHEIGSREAWKRFWSLGKNHVGSIILFWLIGAGLHLGAALVAMLAGFFTCCLGLLPILHHTLMAPYYVFERTWTLEILASMSPDFDLRAVPSEPSNGDGGGHGAGPIGFGYGPQGGYGPPGGWGPTNGPGGFGGPPPAGGFGFPQR